MGSFLYIPKQLFYVFVIQIADINECLVLNPLEQPGLTRLVRDYPQID